MKKILSSVILVLCALLIFGCTNESEPYVEVPSVGEKIPQFSSLQGSDGNTYNISDFEGRPLLLMFETVDCMYCEKERPSILKLEDKYRDSLQIVTIGMGEEMEQVLPHIESENINHLWLTEGDQFVAVTYLVAGTPDHFFVDNKGILRSRLKGFMTYEQLVENINPLLEANNQ